MSQQDLLRFEQDLKTNPELQSFVKEGATGLAALVERANAKGYDFTLDEAKALMKERGKGELSDAELGAVAGGGSTVTQTVSVQTVATVSTEVQTVETTTTGAAEVEGVAVAVGAVVAT